MHKKTGTAVAVLVSFLLLYSSDAGAGIRPAVLDTIRSGLGAITDGKNVPDAQAVKDSFKKTDPIGAGAVPLSWNERERLRRVPARYRPYAKVVRLKNMLRPIREAGGRFRYERIYATVIAVHPHVALYWSQGSKYMDDLEDKAGNVYYLDFIYMTSGLKSHVTKAVILKSAPSKLLNADQKEIVRDTLIELARSCGKTVDDSMDLDELKGKVDAACAARFVSQHER